MKYNTIKELHQYDLVIFPVTTGKETKMRKTMANVQILNEYHE